VLIFSLAEAGPTPEDKIQALRFGLILIVAIGIIGILLIVAMLTAWRNFHRRISELEAERDEARQADPPPDAWAEAGDRVEIESSQHARDDEDSDEDDSDLYGKDWKPGDDDENPDDDDRPW